MVWANSPWSAVVPPRSRTSSIGPRGPAPGSARGGVGGRRPAGDLLLRRRASNSSASSSPATCATRRAPRCPSRQRSAAWWCPRRVYVAVNLSMGSPDTLAGWAVPTATDIAFALAVLAVLSTHLPTALRTFLLTLAVVDDLLAITSSRCSTPTTWRRGRWRLALVPMALFALCGAARSAPLVGAACRWPSPRGRSCMPAVCTRPWPGCCSASPSRCWAGMPSAERFEHVLRPVSAGFAVPVFAFFAAGVTVGGLGGLWRTR